ncbi:MAG: hypothetical protein JW839_17215 [Candidatus Lokiarchaeota archaeon]|nr:hypothetical protein [Candidatus Lokiarchaeota archaeon]
MKKTTFSFLLISVIAMSGAAFMPSARGIGPADAGLDLVSYFADLFDGDYAIGTQYNAGVDGYGLAASRSVSGSPAFTPYKRAPLDIEGQMQITPVLAPTQAEDAIIDLIERASNKLYIEQMYIYETLNDVLLAIIAARGAGVDVRIIQDDGSYDHNNISATILEAHGIPVRRMVQNSGIGAPFDTMHNKGIVVDGTVAFVASINWSPTSMRNNREAGVIIESASVAGYYEDLFLYDWGKAVDFVPTTSYPDPAPSSSHYFSPTTYSGSFDVTCLAAPDNCFDEVSTALAGAQTSIWMSAYVLSSPFIIDVLYERLAAGVDVRLLLEKYPVSTSERDYNRWAMANLTTIGASQGSGGTNYASGRWASATFTYQHCKYAIVDGKTLIISSGNYAQTSCPKPQADGDVDGNRDWWFVIRGSSAGLSGDTPGAGPVFIVLCASFAALVVAAHARKKVHS